MIWQTVIATIIQAKIPLVLLGAGIQTASIVHEVVINNLQRKKITLEPETTFAYFDNHQARNSLSLGRPVNNACAHFQKPFVDIF